MRVRPRVADAFCLGLRLKQKGAAGQARALGPPGGRPGGEEDRRHRVQRRFAQPRAAMAALSPLLLPPIHGGRAEQDGVYAERRSPALPSSAERFQHVAPRARVPQPPADLLRQLSAVRVAEDHQALGSLPRGRHGRHGASEGPHGFGGRPPPVHGDEHDALARAEGRHRRQRPRQRRAAKQGHMEASLLRPSPGCCCWC
mmetsp:Transcript_2419/g.5630  ORF Transcript_2419/g.5630 Transcript_2419/m.5630 type:complete len:200 (-) Transcript_2419:68-667(-)